MFWYSSYFTDGDVSDRSKGMLLDSLCFGTVGDVSDFSKGMILYDLCFGTVLTLLMVMYQTVLRV